MLKALSKLKLLNCCLNSKISWKECKTTCDTLYVCTTITFLELYRSAFMIRIFVFKELCLDFNVAEVYMYLNKLNGFQKGQAIKCEIQFMDEYWA